MNDALTISDEERQKILNNAFSSLNPPHLKVFPAKESRKLVVIQQIALQFEQGKEYTEKEINDILKPIYEDYVILRRYLIDHGYLTRSQDGRKYWVK